MAKFKVSGLWDSSIEDVDEALEWLTDDGWEVLHIEKVKEVI